MSSNSFKNEDSIDCPLCYNETNGLKMSYHDYLKYQSIFTYVGFKSIDHPLIKCIKCNNYTCILCKTEINKNSIEGCQFNCHEISENKTISCSLAVYYQFGIYKEYDYTPWSNSSLWLAQSIYEYSKNPNSQLRIPSTDLQIQQALDATIQLFDRINVNWDIPSISGLIKLPFENEPITIQYKIYMTISDDPKYNQLEPKYLLDELKMEFQSDIKEFFKVFTDPISFLNNLKDFKQIQDYMPNGEDSVFKLGYTDYIRKVAHIWLDPRTGPTPFNSIKLSFPERIARLYQGISIEHGLLSYYTIESLKREDLREQAYVNTIDRRERNRNLSRLEKEYNETIRRATTDEFNEFFKDCK